MDKNIDRTKVYTYIKKFIIFPHPLLSFNTFFTSWSHLTAVMLYYDIKIDYIFQMSQIRNKDIDLSKEEDQYWSVDKYSKVKHVADMECENDLLNTVHDCTYNSMINNSLMLIILKKFRSATITVAIRIIYSDFYFTSR